MVCEKLGGLELLLRQYLAHSRERREVDVEEIPELVDYRFKF